MSGSFVDADTHVIETEATWELMAGEDRQFRPLPVLDESSGIRYWLLGGQRLFRGNHVNPAYSPGVQELSDLPARLADMDRMGVRTQVIYPSLFLMSNVSDPEADVALCRGYNRWLAEISLRSNGRVRWAIAPPLSSMTEALAEVERGREGGGCAIFIRGLETNRLLNDRYFFPLYAKAQELDLPVCVHVGNSVPAFQQLIPKGGVALAVVPNIVAFQTLLTSQVLAQFPRLRFGFLESGSQWLPYALQQVRRVLQRGVGTPMDRENYGGEHRGPADAMGSQLFVACEADDDLAYVLQLVGPDALIFGTDYGHADPSTELDGFDRINEHPGLGSAERSAIAGRNAERFYNLN